MPLDPGEIKRGTELLVSYLERIIEEQTEINDLHEAFEFYCMHRFSSSNPKRIIKTGRKNQWGIDFYSIQNNNYKVGQCKVPEKDYLDAHPTKIQTFSKSAVIDLEEAADYLLTDKQTKANEDIQYLYADIQGNKSNEDFSITFFLIVFGKIDEKGKIRFDELKKKYSDNKSVEFVLLTIEDIIDEFIIGSKNAGKDIKCTFFIKDKHFSEIDYSYVLASASSIFKEFMNYGWRLFDSNLRYEIKNSKINEDITESLTHHKSRKSFHHFNNGLIITCTHRSFPKPDEMKLTYPQIINGLQTVKSIYNAVKRKMVDLSDLKECFVQVKVIETSTKNPDYISGIVRTTNNQNPMSPRNLKANSREQSLLRKDFSLLNPRWFYQVKDFEWDSLTQEQSRFFKSVVGFSSNDFISEKGKKKVRIIDNEELAKAWLSFIGFSDKAAAQVSTYFDNPNLYDLIFEKSPNEDYWKKFSQAHDFRNSRDGSIISGKVAAIQYLLSFFILKLVKSYIPKPNKYKELALDEGVRDGKIKKEGGSIKSDEKTQIEFLSNNKTFQTWRLLDNMKEISIELVSYILAKKYCNLDEKFCFQIMEKTDASLFFNTGEIHEHSEQIRNKEKYNDNELFSRILEFVRYCIGNYWIENKNIIKTIARLRTYFLSENRIGPLKDKIDEYINDRSFDKIWKKQNMSLIDSLPGITY